MSLAAAVWSPYTPGCETRTGMTRARSNPQRLAALALLLFAVGLGVVPAADHAHAGSCR